MEGSKSRILYKEHVFDKSADEELLFLYLFPTLGSMSFTIGVLERTVLLGVE